MSRNRFASAQGTTSETQNEIREGVLVCRNHPELDARRHLRRAWLVFSDPHCAPCNLLAPELEKFHRASNASAGHVTLTPGPSPIQWERGTTGEIAVLLISRGEPKENQRKMKEHGLTFPVVLQKQWEISRLYGMFTTPIAYLIDETGIILNDVAVAVEPILELLPKAIRLACRACIGTTVRTPTLTRHL